MPCVLMGYRFCREYSTAVDLSLLVIECAMELTGYHRTTLYQMFKPTYLLSDVFAPLEIKCKGMVLYSAVSSPLDRSKRFTLSSPEYPNAHVC